jgi:hypothetical protein
MSADIRPALAEPEPGDVGELVSERLPDLRQNLETVIRSSRAYDGYSTMTPMELADRIIDAVVYWHPSTLLQQLSAPAPAAAPVAWGNFRTDGTCVGLSQHPEDIARWQNPRPLFLAAPVVDADVRYEFSVFDGDDCEQAGDSAPTLDDAIRAGQYYLSQYNMTWDPHRLELRRVETIPMPQVGEVQP